MNFNYSFSDVARLVTSYSNSLFSISPFNFFVDDGVDDFPTLLREGCYALCPGEETVADRMNRAELAALSERETLLLDAESIYESDPAAGSVEEVMICYPGFFAILCHRLAHALYCERMRLIARFIGEYAHSLTGIDIHPGARIGERFAIDHGTGVVIGESAFIGRGVRIYQGVTIGARSFPRRADGSFDRSVKRHPTVCDGCIIYANATILGGETVVGEGSIVGANVWLTESVPPNTVLYYGRNLK